RVAETIPRRGGITCGGGRASLLEQRLEALEVELTRRETEAVTRRATLYPIAAEERPQPRDVGVERTPGALPGALAPQVVDQSIAGDDLVRVQEQQRQERTLLRPTQR